MGIKKIVSASHLPVNPEPTVIQALSRKIMTAITTAVKRKNFDDPSVVACEAEMKQAYDDACKNSQIQFSLFFFLAPIYAHAVKLNTDDARTIMTYLEKLIESYSDVYTPMVFLLVGKICPVESKNIDFFKGSENLSNQLNQLMEKFSNLETYADILTSHHKFARLNTSMFEKASDQFLLRRSTVDARRYTSTQAVNTSPLGFYIEKFFSTKDFIKRRAVAERLKKDTWYRKQFLWRLAYNMKAFLKSEFFSLKPIVIEAYLKSGDTMWLSTIYKYLVSSHVEVRTHGDFNSALEKWFSKIDSTTIRELKPKNFRTFVFEQFIADPVRLQKMIRALLKKQVDFSDPDWKFVFDRFDVISQGEFDSMVRSVLVNGQFDFSIMRLFGDQLFQISCKDRISGIKSLLQEGDESIQYLVGRFQGTGPGSFSRDTDADFVKKWVLTIDSMMVRRLHPGDFRDFVFKEFILDPVKLLEMVSQLFIDKIDFTNQDWEFIFNLFSLLPKSNLESAVKSILQDTRLERPSRQTFFEQLFEKLSGHQRIALTETFPVEDWLQQGINSEIIRSSHAGVFRTFVLKRFIEEPVRLQEMIRVLVAHSDRDEAWQPIFSYLNQNSEEQLKAVIKAILHDERLAFKLKAQVFIKFSSNLNSSEKAELVKRVLYESLEPTDAFRSELGQNTMIFLLNMFQNQTPFGWKNQYQDEESLALFKRWFSCVENCADIIINLNSKWENDFRDFLFKLYISDLNRLVKMLPLLPDQFSHPDWTLVVERAIAGGETALQFFEQVSRINSMRPFPHLGCRYLEGKILNTLS